MTAKEYLEQVRQQEKQIEADKKALDCLRDMSSRISSSSFEPHYNPNRNIEPPFVKYLGKIKTMENKICSETEKLLSLKIEMVDKIRMLNSSTEQSILIMRYLQGYSWEHIAATLSYSKRWMLKVHNRALQNLEALMEESMDELL